MARLKKKPTRASFYIANGIGIAFALVSVFLSVQYLITSDPDVTHNVSLMKTVLFPGSWQKLTDEAQTSAQNFANTFCSVLVPNGMLWFWELGLSALFFAWVTDCFAGRKLGHLKS